MQTVLGAPPWAVKTSKVYQRGSRRQRRFPNTGYHAPGESTRYKVDNPARSTAAAAAAVAAAQEDGGTAALLQASSCESHLARLYRSPALTTAALDALLKKVQQAGLTHVKEIQSEWCFNIGLTSGLDERSAAVLTWMLREPFEPSQLTLKTRFPPGQDSTAVVEVGPRLNFSTAWSANAVSICTACGVSSVNRLEASRRFQLSSDAPLTEADLSTFAALVHDRMTEQVYMSPLESFEVAKQPAPVQRVPVLEKGMRAIEELDERLGLAFDETDKQYYYDLFVNQMQRDPTDVELFDLAQSNSEHCRHWFFRGLMRIGGVDMPHTLFELVQAPYKAHPNNSVIAFKDNSSAIRGFPADPMLPAHPGMPSELAPTPRTWDLLLTAETHNFPCAVAPYPGAETGSGGRIRDTHATGKGSIMAAATAGYCVGNLRIPGYPLDWEDSAAPYPDNLADPLQILIDASNGASDYGNKFGEPVVGGYTRSFGLRLADGTRREWIKPIMFSGGVGFIDREHHSKDPPELGMLVVKIGGPAYRIGMGGGAASSVPSGGSGKADLDFNAVQRGDAEMAQKLWRVVRACVELGGANPIVQIHDQGAGGNCNVVKEIIYPLGAEINIREVQLGDTTMSTLEIWGAEYQENDCVLIHEADRALLQRICDRERVAMQVIGTCNGSGRIVLNDPAAAADDPTPVDLDLETILGDLPQKTYEFPEFAPGVQQPLTLPEDVPSMLRNVLRLPSVCSKRFLTTKVDRCVTGLVAQQQCVGPFHTPVADVAVIAQSHTGGAQPGLATAIGEQPLKGLLDPCAMARLALTEGLMNLVFAAVTDLADVRASVNWMYAAKMGSEGAAMYMAAEALKDAMIVTGVACDGGKDSLSMAATASGERVMAPGNLVISLYAGCTNITKTVTPDLKQAGSALLHVDLGKQQRRLGGSALAQTLNQVGDSCPDVDIKDVAAAFQLTQSLVQTGGLRAGHDVSDGGLIVTLLEMAFAGVAGIDVDVPEYGTHAASLFAEEPGLVLEVAKDLAPDIVRGYSDVGVQCTVIGTTTPEATCRVAVSGAPVISESVTRLLQDWDATAAQLEQLQAVPSVVEAEQVALQSRWVPEWQLSWTPEWTDRGDELGAGSAPRVAVLREEGSNGDREMAAAVHAAGMEPWDITMSDLLAGRATLDDFSGVVYVGGFSYADTLDSGKGWASAIRFSSHVLQQFEAFYAREDTFSLGVCNGCQLMALLGLVPGGQGVLSSSEQELTQPRFMHNSSERFECRWSTVSILESPSIFLSGMEGSTLGVWVAHGEGRCFFPDEAVNKRVLDSNLAPIRYTGPDGHSSAQYPYNPNGSPDGIAALCSEDGRHLAMMPHPERCFLGWQVPWQPTGVAVQKDGPGPWLKLFQNAAAWVRTKK